MGGIMVPADKLPKDVQSVMREHFGELTTMQCIYSSFWYQLGGFFMKLPHAIDVPDILKSEVERPRGVLKNGDNLRNGRPVQVKELIADIRKSVCFIDSRKGLLDAKSFATQKDKAIKFIEDNIGEDQYIFVFREVVLENGKKVKPCPQSLRLVQTDTKYGFDCGSGKIVAVTQDGLAVQINGKDLKLDIAKDQKIKFMKGAEKMQAILADLQQQIELCSDSEMQRELYNATWFGTAHWRQENTRGGDNNEWHILKTTLKRYDFTGKAVLMSQEEEGENDAIHVHENILPEFYANNLSLLLGNNIKSSKFVAGGSKSVQVCIKPIKIGIEMLQGLCLEGNGSFQSIEEHSGKAAAGKLVPAFDKGDYVKGGKSGYLSRFNRGCIGLITATQHVYTVEWKLKRDMRTKADKGTSTNLDKKYFVGGPLQPHELPEILGGSLNVPARRRMGDRIVTEFNKEQPIGRRRMAQREFSSRRDSPVMTRLLGEIVRANQKHNELN